MNAVLYQKKDFNIKVSFKSLVDFREVYITHESCNPCCIEEVEFGKGDGFKIWKGETKCARVGTKSM